MAKLDESTLVQMGREYPDYGAGYVVGKVGIIAKLAKRHETACVNACNTGDEKYDRQIERIEAKLDSECASLFPGTVVKTQRDPRGATVKLLPPSGATNDWGREGLCVLA